MSPAARRRAGRRRAAAIAAAPVWVLGLYALPYLHNLEHRSDHSHGPHVHASGSSTPHDHDHDRDHRHDGAKEAPEESSPTPIDDDHGAGSILHFAAVALDGEAQQVLPATRPLSPPPISSPRPRASLPNRPVLVRGPPLVD